MILDSLANLERYGHSPALLLIGDFCRKRLASVADGTYELMGDSSVRALVQSLAPRMRGNQMETHRRHVDLHTVIEGCEGLEWCEASRLLPNSSYNEAEDVIHYPAPKHTVGRIELTPGLFALLMPNDAHITGLLAGSPSEGIRKVVFKIAVDKLVLGS
jgi:YhcH/YjgK/YiaL family protein